MKAAPAASDPLDQWLRWLETLHPRQVDLGLERVSAVAARLGLDHPDAVTLTIAGTNGKGTSARLAASMLAAAGRSVGLYTSPHLLRFNERIEIGGAPVSDPEIVAALWRVNQARGETPLTYFEAGTLAAMQLFADAGVQVQVLEVGLGGRLDAVNLVDADVSLLSSVGIDHVDWLGGDRESIGWEKAHIFRAARPAICADPDPPASVRAHASRIGADLACLGPDFRLEGRPDDMVWEGFGQRIESLAAAPEAGASVWRNLAGAIAAVLRLPETVRPDAEAIRKGLAATRVPGRFERRGRLLLDVAHNVEAAKLLAAQIGVAYPGQGLTAVIGMLQGKDVDGFVDALAQSLAAVHCADLPPPRGLPAGEILQIARQKGLEAQAFPSIDSAIDAALLQASPEFPVLVTGSFLTVERGLRHG